MLLDNLYDHRMLVRDSIVAKPFCTTALFDASCPQNRYNFAPRRFTVPCSVLGPGRKVPLAYCAYSWRQRAGELFANSCSRQIWAGPFRRQFAGRPLA